MFVYLQRNVGYETSEKELSDLFSEFGEVAYVKILVDRMTERSKGMAFVQFNEKSGAETVLEAIEDPQQVRTSDHPRGI